MGLTSQQLVLPDPSSILVWGTLTPCTHWGLRQLVQAGLAAIGVASGITGNWVQIPAPPVPGRVTLGDLPDLSEPQHPHL